MSAPESIPALVKRIREILVEQRSPYRTHITMVIERADLTRLLALVEAGEHLKHTASQFLNRCADASRDLDDAQTALNGLRSALLVWDRAERGGNE